MLLPLMSPLPPPLSDGGPEPLHVQHDQSAAVAAFPLISRRAPRDTRLGGGSNGLLDPLLDDRLEPVNVLLELRLRLRHSTSISAGLGAAV